MKTFNFTFEVSKLLKGFSCPLMAMGVFGLLLKQPQILLWWVLIGTGVAIIIFDAFTFNGITQTKEEEV